MANSLKNNDLTARLADDPGAFEPITAFRIAQASAPFLEVQTHLGTAPAALAISHFACHGETAEVRTAFAPINGITGALPPAYDALVARQNRSRAFGLGCFLDMFNARLAELFADASEKYRLARRLRWASKRHETNAFTTALLALCGFGTRGLEHSSVNRETLLRFSGAFSNRTRNAASLRAMLQEVSGLPVDVTLFHGRWLDIPEHEQSQLTRTNAVQLGKNATAGAKLRDFSSGFRVVIGPVSYADYRTLAPGSEAVGTLFDLTRLFVGQGLSFDIQIVLRREDVPVCQLGGKSGAPRLGWNSWACLNPAVADRRDAILREPPPLSAQVRHAA